MSKAETISFEEAVRDSAHLLAEIDAGRLDAKEISDAVYALVQSMAGARGFFVTYLTDESNIGEVHPDSIVSGLARSPEIVNDLITKNLVMSSAMALSHKRQSAFSLLAGSQRVARRCMSLAKRLWTENLSTRLDAMQAALTAVLMHKQDGADLELTLSPYSFAGSDKVDVQMQEEYDAFLQKWKYDAEQLQAAQHNFKALLKQ